MTRWSAVFMSNSVPDREELRRQLGTYAALVSDLGGLTAPHNHLLRQEAAAYATRLRTSRLPPRLRASA